MDMPSLDDVLAAIDALPPDYIAPDGSKYVGFWMLARRLFPAGSPAWERPVGQPHGRDKSPAYNFMEGLTYGRMAGIRSTRPGRTEMIGRAKSSPQQKDDDNGAA